MPRRIWKCYRQRCTLTSFKLHLGIVSLHIYLCIIHIVALALHWPTLKKDIYDHQLASWIDELDLMVTLKVSMFSFQKVLGFWAF